MAVDVRKPLEKFGAHLLAARDQNLSEADIVVRLIIGCVSLSFIPSHFACQRIYFCSVTAGGGDCDARRNVRKGPVNFGDLAPNAFPLKPRTAVLGICQHLGVQ